jgi:uncharacterized protein
MLKILLEIMKITAIVVVTGSLLLYLLQGKMIFFPEPIPAADLRRFTAREVVFEHKGVALHGWHLKGPITCERPLIIYYGGNAEEVSHNLYDLDRVESDAFLLINYRGYGQSRGRPSEKALVADALFIFDQVVAAEGVNPAHVVLMGRSLGSGVAVQVAARRPVGGLILVTPLDSLARVGRHHYPFLPVKPLLRHRFDAVALAPAITAPALFLMGERDTIIPNANSLNLARHWGGPVETVVIPEASHNDISYGPDYWQAINRFLAERCDSAPLNPDQALQ